MRGRHTSEWRRHISHLHCSPFYLSKFGAIGAQPSSRKHSVRSTLTVNMARNVAPSLGRIRAAVGTRSILFNFHNYSSDSNDDLPEPVRIVAETGTKFDRAWHKGSKLETGSSSWPGGDEHGRSSTARRRVVGERPAAVQT